MIKSLAMIVGLLGAVVLSQFPEFSQQYFQRLAGARTELGAITTGFDLTATAAGLNRQDALAKLGDNKFQVSLRDQMLGNFDRYDRLDSAYQSLKNAEPLARLTKVWHFSDPDLARQTWQEYRPAIPVTTDGLICAAIGFVAGWLLTSFLLNAFLRPFFRQA